MEPLNLAGRSDEVDGCGREGGDGTLHVRGAAPVDEAIGDVGGKGRMRPGIHMALGHHVGMPREAQMRRARAEAGKEILHIRRVRVLEDQALADEAGLRQAIFQQCQGAAFAGGYGPAADKLLQQRYGVGRGVLHADSIDGNEMPGHKGRAC